MKKTEVDQTPSSYKSIVSKGNKLYELNQFAPVGGKQSRAMGSVAQGIRNGQEGDLTKKGQVDRSPYLSEYNPSGNAYGANKNANKYATAKRYVPNAIPSFDPENPKEDAIVNNQELKKKATDLNKVAPDGERLAYINPFEELMLKQMGGMGKPAAGDIPSYKKGDVDAPPPRDVGTETRDNLQAQVDLAPELFSSESQFRPQYADLERGIQLEQLGIDPSLGLLEAYRDYIVPAQGEMKRKSTAQ